MKKTILVVGSINMDLVARATHIPVAGETVSGTSFATYPGGKGANQAVSIAKLGHPVTLIGRLGSDSFGEVLQRGLQAAGVDTSGVKQVPGSSGVAVIVVSDQGEIVSSSPQELTRCSPQMISRNMSTTSEELEPF